MLRVKDGFNNKLTADFLKIFFFKAMVLLFGDMRQQIPKMQQH
jgi:hypothetical protein